MPTLPIPMIGSLFLFFVLINALIRQRISLLFGVLLAAAAMQGVVISLAQHYEAGIFRMVQPVTAAVIPPLAWITFQGSAVRKLKLSRDWVHVIGPLFILFCLFFVPAQLDFAIPALFVAYGAAMLLTLAKGVDALPFVRLESGDLPRLIWQVIGFSLIASAASDVLIILSQMVGLSAWQPWIIAISTTVMLLIVGGLSLSQSLTRGDETTDQALSPEETNAASAEQDADIMARLDSLLAEQKLYLDPDLSLGQMSRKLRVPVKQLSGAINRSTGENVSRYINRQRIKAACMALESGENVTTTMYASGFNTKSNFNREFLRIMEVPPRVWLERKGK